ncbi:MAG: hypothetical protein M1834_003709 [Cirrosporium novae-zelandiae]|nr:MAG: hypothetical protein M1834_003709 [Cirrosporium novae-zelandiae]
MGKTLDRDGEIRQNTLGSLRIRHHETNEIILVPTPTNDPNDPLNWSSGYRYYLVILVCLAIFFCNFLAAGPTVAIVETTEDFFGPMGPDFNSQIAKVSYFYSTTAFLQGLGNLFWMPIILKYGRRPAYICSFTLYTACAAWAGGSTSYGSELASRIIMGFANGAGECLAPLTIADIFYLHERGHFMAIYTAFLSAGVGGGIVISGLITINHSWRYIYWVAVALIGALTCLVILTFPETEYDRSPKISNLGQPYEPPMTFEEAEIGLGTKSLTDKDSIRFKHQKEGGPEHSHTERSQDREAANETVPIPKKRTYLETLKIFTGTYTDESLLKLFLRPVLLLALPPVLYATLCMSVTIGFLVAITSNFATAFSTYYGFEAWQSGLCFISALIGSAAGIFFGGRFGDWVADWFTRRNNGVREPEMRLPGMILGGCLAPTSLVMYGVGIGNGVHWICPTIALGLLTFSIVQATNITLVYTIDAYRPIAGEITVTQLCFKACFGFLLSFYTNPWIDEAGYQRAFGAMAGISGGVLIWGIFFYFFGRRIRHATWEWNWVKAGVHWGGDREVGE